MARNIPAADPKKQLGVIASYFLEHPDEKYSKYELEAKFGTRGIKPITKLDYDNVIKTLLSLGYHTSNPTGTYTLKIQPEFLDAKTGEFKNTPDLDRFRVEITGMPAIQEYCRTDDIKAVMNKHQQAVKIMKKMDVRPVKEKDEIIQSANFDDFNFRVTLKREESVSKNGKAGLELIDNWQRSKKVFRYINRVSFVHNYSDFTIDMSIVKSSTRAERAGLIKTYNIEDSNVFDNPETYEIEIEAESIARPRWHNKAEGFVKSFQKNIKYVLMGLQETKYPVSYKEQKEVLADYMRLLFEDEFKKKNEKYVPKERVYPSDFIGPSTKSLQLKNIGPINPDIQCPNITEPYTYCVTAKADGNRCLLYVNGSGRIYLINMNMKVMFTGAKTEEPRCFNSLLDGEHILHNTDGGYINHYAAFDIYYVNKNDVRELPFMETPLKEAKYFEKGCRVPMLKEFVKILKEKNIDTTQSKSPIYIEAKRFYPLFEPHRKTGEEETAVSKSHRSSKYSIFEASNYVLSMLEIMEFPCDGLIFTPTLYGVGGSRYMETGPKCKITWDYSFKWKPSEQTENFPKAYNTIDFLVTTKKASDGQDIITPIFENGQNFSEATQYNQYKTLILAVGYDEKRHGFINPCQDLLDDNIPEPRGPETRRCDSDNYKPKQFYPTDPYDPQAGLCNIMLELDSAGNYQMFTEEREVFGDQTIVEFRYDKNAEGLWRWKPLRVRYDKTADFRQGNNSFGNDYTTANSNWYSIHYPITEEMITTGQGIPSTSVAEDVYYNGSSSSEKLTRGLRDFHNLYVKKLLIQSVSRRGNTLIDLACGKAGDFPKWIAANLSFVFGIDISKDNLENRLNGACARYLNYKRDNKATPYALFVNGNCALNIRSGTNMFSDKANSITKAVFGQGPKASNLGPAVERQYAHGANGFDVCSCQFALHYMFENKKTFYNFLRNVAETTKLNGYFIGTCYDGRTIFNMLKKKEQGEVSDIYYREKKIWSITKDYDSMRFDNNDSSLGYKINVYQDTINQTLPEYLVNADFFIEEMAKYGFNIVSRDEARQIGLPEGTGLFIELYNQMMRELDNLPRREAEIKYGDAYDMRNYEKDISFLNRYFVFKKIRTINAEKLTQSIIDLVPEEYDFENAQTILAREAVKQAEEEIKPKAKKLRERLKMIEATEALEEQRGQQEQQEQREPEVGQKKTTRKKRPKIVEFVEVEEK